MKKLLTSFVLILTAIALTGCGSASKTMARNLDNTITNLVYSVSNLDVLDNATINQVKNLSNNQKAAQSALCFLTNNTANDSVFANTTCPECCQSGECNENNCNNIDVTDSPNNTDDNNNKIAKNAFSGVNVENINKFSQNDDENAKFTGEHPHSNTHPDVKKIDTNNAYESNENFCKNNQTDCDNCKPICNEPINIDHGLSVDDPNSTANNANNSANNNDNNTVTSNIKDDISANNNSTGNRANYNTSTGNYTNSNTNTDNNDAVDTADNRNNDTTKNNSIGINSENITDGDANKILNQTGITTGGTDIDTSTSTNSIYSDLATSSARISELIADLVKVRTVIMLYISDLYNGSITLSQDEINAINSYANIIKESTAYLKSNQGTVKNHLNEATSFGETDAYASLANSHIIRATEVLNTRGAKIESAVVATMNIIDILKTNVENAKSQSTTDNSNGANSAPNTTGDTKGQNANTSQILEGNVANASFEGSGLFGGGSPNYAMNNPYNMGVNGQNYGGGAYPFGAAYPMGGINYGMGGVGTIGAYPYGAGVGIGTGMINGMAYPYGVGGNGVGISGAAIYPYGMVGGAGFGTYPYGAGVGIGTGIGAYPYGMGVAGTGIANGMGGFGYPNGGAIVDGNGVIGEVGIGGAGLAGNGIIGNGAGVAGGIGVGTGVVNSGVGNTYINGGAMPNVLTGLVSNDDQQPLTDAKTNIDDNITLSNNNTDNNSSDTKTQADAQPLTNTQQCDSDQVNLANENVACTAQPYTKNANKKNVRTYTPNPLFGANVNKKSFYDLATQDYINTSSAAEQTLPATKPNAIIPANDNNYPAVQLSNADNQYPAAQLPNADNQYPAVQLSNADNQYPAVQLPNGDERYPIITLPDTSQRRPVVTI